MNLSSLGVTPQKAKQFEQKNIMTAEDLIRYFPRKYNDFSKETGILPEKEISCLVYHVDSFIRGTNSRIPWFKARGYVVETAECLDITWFHQNYLLDKYSYCKGRDVLVAGKIKYNEKYGNYEMSTPVLFEPNISAGKKIYPVYSKIPGMSNEYLTGKIQKAIDYTALSGEVLPANIVSAQRLPSMQDTFYNLHFPRSQYAIESAQRRLIFNDLTYFALYQEWTKRNSVESTPFFIKSKSLMNEICTSLPYKLTEDQYKAVREMLDHVASGKRINALVQGDVGCGKTIVAFLMMAAFAGSGYQTVIMAPTQILAGQHYAELKSLVEPLGHEVAFLSGNMKASEKSKMLEKIADGSVKFIVGTHAAIGKAVQYNNLALTVTDEEHKFGVAQRNTLAEKASAGVHNITMSATPIPRSLAQAFYGNAVQLHTIESMPAGRVPVMTGVAVNRDKIYNFLKNQITKLHHQAYVVCPMIDQNEEMENVKSVEEISEEYKDALIPHGIRIETLTGRNSKEETENITAEFKAGNIDILIATTVIEVGVNVPNATVIVITSAERFGLSTLHQLRGRVGRSSFKSYCVLEYDEKTEDAKKRMEIMCNTTSGFEIAKYDLEMRGAGDLTGGTRQSGDNKFLAYTLAYPELFKSAQNVAAELLDNNTSCRLVKQVLAELNDAEGENT